MTRVEGRKAVFPHPPAIVFPMFSDMRNFVANLPEDKKKDISATADYITGKVQGFEMGVEIEERLPFSIIRLKEYGTSPFKFHVNLNFCPNDHGGTDFHLVLEADLNMMMKMMIGGRLKEAVDKFTDVLESVMNGKIPQEYEQYVNGRG